jgi:two-component system response regulator HydG
LLLAQHFLRVAADRMRRPVRSFSAPAAEKLLAYSWPGNVRELQNCIERAVALARFDEISVDDLTDRIRDHQRTYAVVASDNPGEILPMDVVERQYVMRVLAAVGGNKATAAKLLGFDRATLYRKLERWGASG